MKLFVFINIQSVDDNIFLFSSTQIVRSKHIRHSQLTNSQADLLV